MLIKVLLVSGVILSTIVIKTIDNLNQRLDYVCSELRDIEEEETQYGWNKNFKKNERTQ